MKPGLLGRVSWIKSNCFSTSLRLDSDGSILDSKEGDPDDANIVIGPK